MLMGRLEHYISMVTVGCADNGLIPVLIPLYLRGNFYPFLNKGGGGSRHNLLLGRKQLLTLSRGIRRLSQVGINAGKQVYCQFVSLGYHSSPRQRGLGICCWIIDNQDFGYLHY